jgi:ubiquitin C-terminal hydrolase
LARHPAGGVPTWLLEVGQDSIISLASLSHYYWYGGGSIDSPYLPSSSTETEKEANGTEDADATLMPGAWNKRQQALALTIPGREVVQFFMAILLPEATNAPVDPASPNGSAVNGSHHVSQLAANNGPLNKQPASPMKKNSTLPFKRRSSQNNGTNESAMQDDLEFPRTEMMERLKQQEAAARSSNWTMDSLSALDDYCTESSRRRFAEFAAEWLKLHPSTIADMTIFDFDSFCRNALDDDCVAAIMHRLFAQGWIPNPSMELDLVKATWREWQETSDALVKWSNALEQTADGALEILSQNVRKVLENGCDTADDSKSKARRTKRPFGGLGGFDGCGGTGFGLLYCIEKEWWDAWESYVGWSWAGDSCVAGGDCSFDGAVGLQGKRKRARPVELSTNKLLIRDDDAMLAGILGSYQLMRTNMKRDVDYVLIPSPVWDVLFELYSGGPPLPRMVVPPERASTANTLTASEDSIEVSSSNGGRDIHAIPSELDLDAMASADNADRVLRIPRLMEVDTHPWVLHFQLCDPQQPYRKQEPNDAGPITIRVMASPDQPFWRLFAEVVVRLPFHLYKPYGPNGQGRARLWKRTDVAGPKTGYGPWPCSLLCKNRSAILPNQDYEREFQENFNLLRSDWEAYADHATVGSSGLANGSQVLVEFGVFRNGEMIWPRETAAKAGMVRRLADKDRQFRRMLMGLDVHGKPLATPTDLVGLSIDAMDPSGRWYEVTISHVKNVDPDTDEEDDDSLDDSRRVYKQVRVDFTIHGGHAEWIDVESDRLASAGRYTMGKRDGAIESPPKPPPAPSNGTETKNKAQLQAKKATPDNVESNAKVCTMPGYGACGLANLGNTCYINSALQCISYFPLLRSYLLSGQYKTTGDLNKDNPLGTEGRLLEEFVALLREMWSAKIGEKSPVRMRSLIAKLKPDVFAGADQQDAQELLSYVLDALMEDSNRVRKKPYVEGLEDDWVKSVPLKRVAEEAWRRERRRSRSIVTDVVTGQTLSTTTCPVCHYASQKFDIFNLLSVPLPTVADVFFKCLVVRRANSFNTPWVLNRPRNKKAGPRFKTKSKPKPPSEQLIVEQYIVGVSRLADSNDLRQKIQSISGIPFSSLVVCSAEERPVTNAKDDGTVIRRRMHMEMLNNAKKPCGQLVSRQRTTSEDLGTTQVVPGLIVAFESTLRFRPKEKELDSQEDASESIDDEDGQDDSEGPGFPSAKQAKELEMLVSKYGGVDECRLYDTDTLPIAKAISRSIWPTSEEQLKLGLRVDALDQKNNWCTGSVVEIIGKSPADGESKEDITESRKVKIHFDNFSDKWDEYYTIKDFRTKRVQPLYSHSPGKNKPTEFIVHHRYTDRVSRASHLFGQSFFVHCHSEWTTARAGAQILAQASRFLSQCPVPPGPVDIDAAQEREARVEKLYDRTQNVISELIDMLIDFDREFVLCSLGLKDDTEVNGDKKKFCNPQFDGSHLSMALVKRISDKLHRLPFELRVGFGTTDAQLTSDDSEDTLFPFSLVRTIGNFVGARKCIVLQWREPPSDKKSSPTGYSKHSNYLGAPVMYNPPKVVVDEESAEILNKVNQKAKKHASGGRGSAGLPLSVCLTEFCKVQKLGEDEEEETPWRCPRCKDFRPGANQKMVLWRLPDILTIHLKRFRSSHKFREKITTKVNFPLTGLDMREWCHLESQIVQDQTSGESYVYDLIGVLNHLGSIAGGHYVATCKATPCSKDGREEVAFDFNGYGTTAPAIVEEEPESSPAWKFGRQKVEVNLNKVVAAATAKAVGESAEPLWLQFDDEYVEPIPPRDVVTETAYVLFYRRRRLTTANVARYSTLD